MTENVEKNEKNIQKVKPEIPIYRKSEWLGECGVDADIIPMDLEQLITEKMYILFEKQEPILRELKSKQLELQNKREELLRTTDFKKELNITTKPTKDDKEAVMRPKLEDIIQKIEELEEKSSFYKNKIIVLNDLIKMRRLQLRMESALVE